MVTLNVGNGTNPKLINLILVLLAIGLVCFIALQVTAASYLIILELRGLSSR
jgi:hypothetical protein